MGFCSTFTTEDYEIAWPQWFRDKYANHIWFSEHNGKYVGPLQSKHEAKTYMTWADLPEDIQKAIDWQAFPLRAFVLVYLHECGGITRCQIQEKVIKWSEPEAWRATDGVTHSYCYHCSDV